MTWKICVALLMVANLAATPAQGGEDGPLNGQGTFKWPNGDQYTGNWVDDNMQGQGTFKSANGNEYTGNWVNGRKQGQGTYKYADGGQYAGNWVDNKRNGQGTKKYPDGNEYTGNWADDKMQGQGTYKWAGGNQYTGNFADNKQQGQGTHKWANGGEYTGNWADDKMQGQGTKKWPSGNEYTGNWADDKMHGQGTYKWANGTRFEGEWRDGIKFSGSEIRPDGTRVEIANGEVVRSPPQAAAAPSTQPTAKTQAAPTTRPCMTAKQDDAFLETALTGGSIVDKKTPASPTDVVKDSGEILGDQVEAAVKNGAGPSIGIRAKSQQINSELRAHIETLYHEYRRLAAEEKVTSEVRDLYAKEKIGPRLDTITANERNWEGVSADRSKLAGQVYAYVELVEIERQEREGLKHHADTEKVCMQNWALRVRDNALGEVKDYEVSWEEHRQMCLAHFKKMFYSSPQYLKAQQFKKTIAEQQVRATTIEQASRDCEGADAAPDALRHPGANSGADKFQSAIKQAEQEERERLAREARERASQVLAAEEKRRASIKAAAKARAYEQEQALKNERDRQEPGVCIPGHEYDSKKCYCVKKPGAPGCARY